MESDSFFYRLFSDLPQAFFELIGEPAATAKSYRFDSVELKKAFRIDGLFLPKSRKLPLYFAEVQFQRRANFYANLFAKVFTYLNENDPNQEWVAVAIFESRQVEPHVGPYDDLLNSKRMKRIYLDEVTTIKNPPVGLGLLQLLFASEAEAKKRVPRIVAQAKSEFADSELQAKLLELMERLLMNQHPELSLEDLRMKFKLHDIRKSKAWQQLREEAHKEGADDKAKEFIEAMTAKGKTHKEIADLLNIPEREVKRLANGRPH